MALSQNQVSQLYVSIFNRASEGSGNKYWQSFSDIASAANAMLATSDAKSYFGSSLDSNQAFIEHIYKNTLNKTYTEDKSGIDYWVSYLGSHTRGDTVAALVYAATQSANAGTAQDQFNNRVSVSNHMADTVYSTPSDYAVSTKFATSGTTGLVVTNDKNSLSTALTKIDSTLATSSSTLKFTSDLIANNKLYTYDTDLNDSNFKQGYDACWEIVFNADGTTTETRYIAPFKTTQWTIDQKDNNTWQLLDNGTINVQGQDDSSSWIDTLTLIGQTATTLTMKHHEVETEYRDPKTSSDDVINVYDEVQTFMLGLPTARSAADIGIA